MVRKAIVSCFGSWTAVYTSPCPLSIADWRGRRNRRMGNVRTTLRPGVDGIRRRDRWPGRLSRAGGTGRPESVHYLLKLRQPCRQLVSKSVTSLAMGSLTSRHANRERSAKDDGADGRSRQRHTLHRRHPYRSTCSKERSGALVPDSTSLRCVGLFATSCHVGQKRLVGRSSRNGNACNRCSGNLSRCDLSTNSGSLSRCEKEDAWP